MTLPLHLRSGNGNAILEVVLALGFFVGYALGARWIGVFGGWFHICGVGEEGFEDCGRTTLAHGIGY